ncbi:MAG: hypothetical protein OXE92_02125 [Bacteroidetes bacterium]|nr:hypothetical protein [Bacteroidota bacterium]MCY4204505.1 hypothetical protein [Bacteroidota bacterium]
MRKDNFGKKRSKKLGFSYFTFDDKDTRLLVAQNDPLGFVSDCPDHTILDEIQRVPGLARILKLSVDRHRMPGRFIRMHTANIYSLFTNFVGL